MEDFLKDKWSELDTDFPNDWDSFEPKLERALFFKRLRIGAALTLFLIATSIGIFGTSSLVGFGVADEAPFGLLTKDGYESSGSHSTWKKEKGENSEIEPSAISYNEVADADNTDESVTQNTQTGQGAKPSPKETAMVLGGEDDESQTASEVKLNNSLQEESGRLTSEKSGMAEANSGLKASDQLSSSTPNLATAQKSSSKKVTAVAVSKPVPSTKSTAATSTNASNGVTSGYSVAEGGGHSPAGLMSNHSEGSVAGRMSEAGSKLKIHIPDLDLNNSEMGIAVQALRVPVQAVKVSKPRGPYISPLQDNSLWEYSIKVYPNFTFRKFKVDPDKLYFIHRDFIDQVKSSESGGFSLNVGLEVSRQIGPATYLNTGLEYISYKTTANFNFTNYRTANINDTTGMIANYSIMEDPEQITFSDDNTYHYLNIPFSIAYRPWATDHIRLNIEAGVSYMYFITASGKSLDYRTLEIIDLSDRDFRNHMGSLNLKVGATYYVSPKLNLGFEPTFVYFTNTIYSEQYPFEVIPYSVGLNLKLQVKLN